MKTILVIEDNEEIRENTKELLELNGYRVVTAVNGRSGYELARSSCPQLIICDMMMPESDGRMFLRLAKEDAVVRHIPLVFFSAGSVSPELQHTLTRKANGFLKKPFTSEELLGTVVRTLSMDRRRA